MTDRILVTGAGLETCIGGDLTAFWRNLTEGHSGIRPLTSFDPSDFPLKIGGEIDLDPTAFMSRTDVRRTCRHHHLLMSAVSKACERLNLRSGDVVALVVGSGGGGEAAMAAEFERHAERLATQGWRAFDRLAVTRVLPNMATAFVADKLRIHGPCLTVTTACASSTDAVGIAAALLRSKAADVAIAAGVDAWLGPYSLGGFCKLQAVSTRPATEAAIASRPFDRDRDGMVPAEGAGAVILERESTGRLRGEEVLGAVLGYGSSCDAEHPVMPRADGAIAAAAVQRALAQSGLGDDEIEHINAHGTSTPLNDVAETRALKRVFGPRCADIPLTANKSVIGHASGACGILEMIATLQTIRTGIVPPTLNLNNPDPECDLDYTPLVARKRTVRAAITCNFGFGGQNAALTLAAAD